MDATNSAETNTAAEGNVANTTTQASLDDTSIAAAPSYDEPYRFGRKPNSRAPFPFTEREFARLLIARSRVQADPSADDQLAA